MKKFGLILSCISLAGCAADINPELAKPTAETIRAKGVPANLVEESLRYETRAWAERVLKEGSGATPRQIAEAKETLEVKRATMMVRPTHDLDAGGQTSSPGAAVFSEGNVTFDCDLVSAGKDARGRPMVTLRLKGMSDVPHVSDRMFVTAKPSVELITVISSRLPQIPVAKSKLSVTVRRTGDVAALNAEPPGGYYVVADHTRLPDGRYKLSMSDEKKARTPMQVIVDQTDNASFDRWIDFFSLTSRGWTSWSYEKGPGSSDLSWLTSSKKGRGAFD